MIMTRTIITICTSTVATTGTRTMEKNNSIYCRYCSTSPKVEPPGFCESMRATFRFWKFSRFIWSLIWQLGLIWTGLMMMAMMKSTPLCTGLMISCRRMISDPRPLQSLFAGNAVFIFILDFILFFVQTWSRRYLLNNHLFWGKFRIFTFVLFLRLLFYVFSDQLTIIRLESILGMPLRGNGL